MTLNEVEQAIRNLITNQPMVTTGPSGDVVNSILSVINSYRNFRFLIQSHPAQDSFKFNSLNLSQRMESDLSNVICQTLQERGINLMMYMPASQFGMNQNPYPYNMTNNVGANLSPNMSSGVLGGQVVYNNQVSPNNPYFQGMSGQMQQTMPPYPQPQNYPNAGPRPVMMMNNPVQPMRNGSQHYPKTSAPTQPISFGDLNGKSKAEMRGNPVQSRPVQRKPEFSVPAREQKIRKNNTTGSKINTVSRPEPVKQEEKPQVAQQIEPAKQEVRVEEPAKQEEQQPNIVKATGRDYLLELLKK